MNQLEGDFTAIEDSWNEVTNQFSDLEPAYYAVNNELTDIQGLVRENDGVRILTGYMANPPSTFEQKIAVELYNVITSYSIHYTKLYDADEPEWRTWPILHP